MIYELPEPSGDVQWHDIKNSYGLRGCYKVGTHEFENPQEDVQWAAQYLADALHALTFVNENKVDRIAAAARDAYYGIDGDADMKVWAGLDVNYKERWRAAVRVVLDAAQI